MKKTNILLITSDQQHWYTLGCLNPEIRTPNLDRLAAQGTLFTRAYCPNPTCTPTRASIITGKYPSQHGAWSLGTKLPESEPTVGDVFRANGYKAGLIGKAHFQQLRSGQGFDSLESYPTLQDLDFWRSFNDIFYGFDHVELARNHTDEAHVGQHYAIWMEEQGLSDWRDHFRQLDQDRPAQKHSWSLPETYHYNTWITERTNALIDQCQADDQPFFIWASFFDPHPSYLVPKPWDTMYDPADLTVPSLVEGEHQHNPDHFRKTQQRDADWSDWQEEGGNGMHGCNCHLHDRDEMARNIAIYYGMISLLDKYVGKLLDHLDEAGLAEETLVVFTTDHGHFYGHHGLIAKGPFHYEDMLRVPFIVRQPGKVPANRRSEALQNLVDLAPTFLAACDLDIPEAMTGVNELPVWYGEAETARQHSVTEFRHQPTTIHMKSYIDERYKLTIYYQQPYGELFDLVEDPDELHNRWDDPRYLDLKHDLMLRLLLAEMDKEETLTAETIRLPQKSRAMYLKTISQDGFRLTLDPRQQVWELVHLDHDPEGETNLWDHPDYLEQRRQLVERLLHERLGGEPLWMPRVASA